MLNTWSFQDSRCFLPREPQESALAKPFIARAVDCPRKCHAARFKRSFAMPCGVAPSAGTVNVTMENSTTFILSLSIASLVRHGFQYNVWEVSSPLRSVSPCFQCDPIAPTSVEVSAWDVRLELKSSDALASFLYFGLRPAQKGSFSIARTQSSVAPVAPSVFQDVEE